MQQLHRHIPNKELPAILKEPLAFGNRDQINALAALEARIKEMETEKAAKDEGLLKYYNVKIEYTGTFETKVLAANEANAKEKAREEVDMSDDVDMEEDWITAREIKNK
jgi:hypothetical protein